MLLLRVPAQSSTPRLCEVADLRRLKARKAGSVQHSRRSDLVRRKWLILGFLTAACVISWQLARQQPTFELRPLVSATAAAQLPESQGDSIAWPRMPDSPFGTKRRVFAYSVIPGGISTPEELRQVAAKDPVVSRHFQGFNFDRAHLVRLAQKQSIYVSYRIGDRVYWTRGKVTLYPGETLISDGSMEARTRCGNRIALAPLNGGSPLEPPLEELEAPPIRLDPDLSPPPLPSPAAAKLAEVPLAAQKAGHFFWFIPPVYVPPGSSGSSREPLAVTPEPGSLVLISSGLAGICWRIRKAKKNK